MSMGSEYIAETAYERDQAIREFEKQWCIAHKYTSHNLWKTKDGRLLSVSEMETSHIKNCIAMLKRNNSPFLEMFEKMFNRELAKRGELDEYYCNRVERKEK